MMTNIITTTGSLVFLIKTLWFAVIERSCAYVVVSPPSSLPPLLFRHRQLMLGKLGRGGSTSIRMPFVSPRTRTRISAAAAAPTTPDLDSNDPFVVLGLDPSPNLDKKTIKRAYRRMALKYHPDVVTTKDSSPEEKKRASDRFAKINWAYDNLNGKGSGTATSSTSSSAGTTASSSGGWTPPHRRRGNSYSSRGSSSSGSGGSADWKDYIPKYDDEDDYDAGGDSFGAIFSDMFVGAAGAVAGGVGGGGVFRDFVEFLENNYDAYSPGGESGGGKSDDAELRILLQTGSLEDVGNEMDDTNLVVQQLTSKQKSVEDELLTLQAEIKMSTKYLETIDLEERIAELKARQKVVEGYLKKARKRLLSLQTRYKQLIVEGDNDATVAGRGSGSRRGTASSRYSSSSASTTSNDRTDARSASSYSSTASNSGGNGERSTTSSNEKSSSSSGREETFGSFGRGGRGGSSRRRAGRRRAQRETSSSQQESPSYSSSSSSAEKSSARSQQPSSSSSQAQPSSPRVPPHRRSASSFAQEQDDKRRLRELKIDDEFEKLKKELGL